MNNWYLFFPPEVPYASLVGTFLASDDSSLTNTSIAQENHQRHDETLLAAPSKHFGRTIE
ncbi:hypothetical protein J6590_061390 [Homalodisca vitripennis]|nr:hypothetical protein J6590_061390 [Homalodisca vitripennis]